MLGLISLAITFAIVAIGYSQARGFVETRLRFVDAVHRTRTPLLAGLGAALIALPLTLLPLVSGVTAMLFGVSVGMGVASGARSIRRKIGAGL